MSDEILDRTPPPAGQRIAYGSAPSHFGELRVPPGTGPHPVVVAMHGGYWRARYDLAYMGHVCAALTQQGLATWNIEYRRIGEPGAGWPGTFLDVAAATDYLRALAPEYALNLNRVITLGHSAGGHLALWLAARPRIAPESPLRSADPLPIFGAVSLAGVVDLQRAWELRLSGNITETLLDGTPATQPERYRDASPYALLPLDLPQVLVHGTDDTHVPFELSERYVRAAREHGDDDARLVTLPGADHFAVVDPTSSEWPAIARLVRELAV